MMINDNIGKEILNLASAHVRKNRVLQNVLNNVGIFVPGLIEKKFFMNRAKAFNTVIKNSPECKNYIDRLPQNSQIVKALKKGYNFYFADEVNNPSQLHSNALLKSIFRKENPGKYFAVNTETNHNPDLREIESYYDHELTEKVCNAAIAEREERENLKLTKQSLQKNSEVANKLKEIDNELYRTIMFD